MNRWLILLVVFLTAGTTLLSAADLTRENCAQAAAYSRSHGGLALYIRQGGRTVYDDYYPGYSANTPHKIYSGTKSFVAVTALIAQQEGLLTLDEKASDTLTEWKGDRRRNITLNELLSQTSGLDPDDTPINAAHDQFEAAVHVHLIDPPGARFHYGAVGYQAFGEILKRKLSPSGRTVEGYMRDKLFDPLDISVDGWKHDDAGNPLVHAGMILTSKEWAKFGEFIAEVLSSNKKQIVNSQSLASLFIGHKANPAYGLGFWLNHPLPSPRGQKITSLLPAIDGDQMYPGGPKDLYTALGSYKQRLYIIPSLDLVIVRFGYGAPYSDGDFLSRLLTGHPKPDAHTH